MIEGTEGGEEARGDRPWHRPVVLRPFAAAAQNRFGNYFML